jgi:hypothetical protein
MRADCWEMRNVLAICMKPIKAFNYTAPVLQHPYKFDFLERESGKISALRNFSANIGPRGEVAQIFSVDTNQ